MYPLRKFLRRPFSELAALVQTLVTRTDTLESQVAERTHALEEANQRWESLAHAKGTFLANMSHEIRTPLNAIIGFARIGIRENANRKSCECDQHILDAAEHLLGVINDVLDFSKIESGKFTVESRPFHLGQVIHNACDLVEESARKKGIVCNKEDCTDITPLGLWVKGDGMRVQQILTNLLSNAVKFTTRGEVRLRVAREGEQTYFSVIDTGIGMTAAELAHIFVPFEQANATTSRRFGGTGLGLAISQNLANLMGGEITVESTPNVGSTFTLCLPLPATETLPEILKPEAHGPRLAGLRVLAAEDVEVNRIILEDILSLEGADVIFVEDGAEAVHACTTQANRFDVVLMDIEMPVMNGYEATQRIHAAYPDLPVIGLTAHALEASREQGLQAGMACHVTKPYQPEELVAAILRQTPHAGSCDRYHGVPPLEKPQSGRSPRSAGCAA
jgi:signal transduction histidine kinase/ActR/RegA family two-component response regulator